MGRPRNFDTDTAVALAMEEFWTHGYAGTSPAQLADAAGIGKGSLYNTFGSKRQLFAQALARYGRMGADRAEEFLSRPGTTRERIGAYLRETVDSDLAQPVRRGCLAVNTAAELGGRDPEITRALRAIEERLIAVFAARIDQGRREGDVRPGIDARATAEFLLNTNTGLRIRSRTHDTAALYRIIDVALTALLPVACPCYPKAGAVGFPHALVFDLVFKKGHLNEAGPGGQDRGRHRSGQRDRTGHRRGTVRRGRARGRGGPHHHPRT